METRRRRITLLILHLIFFPACISADEFVFFLKTGGQVEGKWLNEDERPIKSYLVQTAQGGKLFLNKSQVKDLSRRSSAEVEYNLIAPTRENTVEGQWALAEWCLENRLPKQRAAHLNRVIQLEPEHIMARRGLGYSQLNGKWMTRDDVRREQGYVKHRGRWRSAQEANLMEKQESRNRAERDWLSQLKKLRKGLDSTHAAEALEKIRAIRDPIAVYALNESLKSELNRRVKTVYLEVLRQIKHDDAVVAIINTSLNDPDLEIYHTCIEQLLEINHHRTPGAYIKGLKSPNNIRVNRSAAALSKLGDQQAVEPLIESLVTTHQLAMPTQQGGGGGGLPLATSFARPNENGTKVCNPQSLGSTNPFGSGGYTFGGNNSQPVSIQVPNQEVLSALIRLTDGVNYGFDQKAWKNWHAVEKRKSPGALTRN